MMSEAAASDPSSDFELALTDLQAEVRQACAEHIRWPNRIAAAVCAAFAYAARGRGGEALGDPSLAPAARLELVDTFAAQLRRASGDLSGSEGVTERTLIGGLLSLVVHHHSLGREATRAGLGPEAAELILIPYLGAEQARLIASAHAT